MTLITGDRVVVAGRNYRVTPGQDREVTFTGQMSGGHLYVIPSDARLLVALPAEGAQRVGLTDAFGQAVVQGRHRTGRAGLVPRLGGEDAVQAEAPPRPPCVSRGRVTVGG
ncbi:hypothetical protein ACIHFD_58130 [Nonomuraea sp. NPDC051941]|uniref:hypothetical protein n=1 Tax=Nonomuraea sp. NPDC051941 TaxID=3364373 RepID=UPI0037CA8589